MARENRIQVAAGVAIRREIIARGVVDRVDRADLDKLLDASPTNSNEAVGDAGRRSISIPPAGRAAREPHEEAGGSYRRAVPTGCSSVPEPAAPGDRVFGDLGDEALRDALAAVMAQAGREWRDRQTGKFVVPHGFRASFGTWAGEHGYEDALIDVALAHAVSSEVLRRYQRGDKVELRREMMQRWADHLDG